MGLRYDFSEIFWKCLSLSIIIASLCLVMYYSTRMAIMALFALSQARLVVLTNYFEDDTIQSDMYDHSMGNPLHDDAKNIPLNDDERGIPLNDEESLFAVKRWWSNKNKPNLYKERRGFRARFRRFGK